MRKSNRRISNLFYNNRFLLVFSIVAAVIIWLVASVEFGDDVEHTVRDVKVNLGENISGLSAFGIDEEITVDVKIKGKKYIVESDETAKDIVVTANTSHVNSVGTNTLVLEVSSNETRPLYEIVGLSRDSIEVFFDYPSEKEFKIETNISFEKNPVPEGYYMADYVLSNAYTVKVTGPESQVNKIEKVVASATLEGGFRQTETFSADLSAVTKDGSTPAHITFGIKTVQIKAPVYKKAYLPVTCNFSNIPVEYLENFPFEVSVSPAMINVGIPENQADGKTSVDLSTKIDFSKLQTGKNVFTIGASSNEITGGILLDDIDSFVVTVDVKNMATKTVAAPTEISVSGVPDGLEAELKQINFDEIVVIGPQEDIASLTTENLIFAADFSEIDENATGVVTVPVRISGDSCWAFGEYTATFTIS